MDQQITPAPSVPTEEAEQKSMNYAGFWIRFAAALIDGVILGIIGRLIFGNEVTNITMNNEGVSAGVYYTGWRNIVPLLYVIGFWIWLSATPGKLALKLKVVDEKGNNITWKTALIRYLGYFVSAAVILIGFITIGFDKKKQGWHDKIAKTYVIKT